MAKKRQGVDLFEVLSEQRMPAAFNQPGSKQPQQEQETQLPEPRVSAKRAEERITTGKELIFSVETAFIIVVAVLTMVGSSYYMGYTAGGRKASPDTGGDAAIIDRPDVAVIKSSGGSSEVASPYIQDTKYTLQIYLSKDLSDKEYKLLTLDQSYVLQLQEVANAGVNEAYIFKKQNGKLYALGLGLFDDRNDPVLDKLRTIMRKVKGPPHREGTPYDGCAVVQVKDMGKPVF
ncbi:MAG: hypothetical protein JXR97_04395 [Planctomycetes bacterium]|nr:hypothetical protein [Planctomycetota bacterium]